MRVHDIDQKATPTPRTPPSGGHSWIDTGGTSWLVLSIVLSVFLLVAAGLHVKEMVRHRNFAWGSTRILTYNIWLPLSPIALLIVGAA